MESKGNMIRRLVRTVGRILSLLLVFGLIYLFYVVLGRVFFNLTTLDPPIAAAFLTAIAAIFGYVYTQTQTTARQIGESHRPNKVKLFEQFMDIVEHFQHTAQIPDKGDTTPFPTPREKRMFQEITRGLLIWGSPSLITSWLKFRRKAGKPGNDTASNLAAMDDVFKSFRHDLGNSNVGLSRGDLIRLFLKDPDELKF